jgi:transposase-like protein
MDFTDVNLNQKFAKQNRTFSETLKKKIVKEIELKRLTIKDAVSLYEVTRTSVYNWLSVYSQNYCKGTKMVVQLDSEYERTKQLLRQVADLERSYGQKQLECEYLQKIIELASREVGFDIKKKLATKQSSFSE